MTTLDVSSVVRERYSQAAREFEGELCCATSYDPRLLKVIPQELLEKDYGCGDPSRFVSPGECVVDLGSGGGKLCYLMSQVVGEKGSVIGVDYNEEMLSLARSYQKQISDAIGYSNVSFRKGKIQDLSLDLELLEDWLRQHPVRSAQDWIKAESEASRIRRESPLVPSGVADVVVSNCVLNLVSPDDRRHLFQEIFRVLKPGGRAVISDIVSNKPIPIELQNDPDLWSACISGAHYEPEFLLAFEQSGFYGIELLDRQKDPWRKIQELEFRSVTVRAWKPGNEANPDSSNPSVVSYHGPWKTVTDDLGTTLVRGEPKPISGERLLSPAYRSEISALEGASPVSNFPILDCQPDGKCC